MAFKAAFLELHGGLQVTGPAAEVFPLFSPLGEKRWVPGWDPEILHPPESIWEQGQIFRTREETGEAIWVVSRLDREGRQVEYHRVEPGRYVARVRVACNPAGEGSTEVRTAYAFIGLSEKGNDEIRAMDTEAYREKMARWERWIRATGLPPGAGAR